MKKRTHYLDNICCVLIVHMIYTYHISYTCGSDMPVCFSFIWTAFSFFMTWFFYKGGMVHKEIGSKDLINKSFYRLIVPYIVFLIIGIFIECFIKCRSSEGFHFIPFIKEEISLLFLTSTIRPTGASWFLLSLFVSRIVFNFLYHRIHPLFITVLFICVSYVIFLMTNNGWIYEIKIFNYHSHIFIPTFYVGNMCLGLSIYSLGYYMKEKQFDKIIFIVSLFVFFAKFLIPSQIDFRVNEPIEGNYILAMLYNVSGCVVINNIFKRYLNRKIMFLTYVGKNSMIYYLVHYPIIFIVSTSYWAPFYNYSYWIRFIILSFIVTFVLIIADFIFRNKKFRFVIGG